MDEVWLEVADIAQALGISQQAIRKRVRSFITRTVTGGKGGGASGGTRYLLLLSSLPPTWQAAYQQRQALELEIPVPPPGLPLLPLPEVPAPVLAEPAPTAVPGTRRVRRPPLAHPAPVPSFTGAVLATPALGVASSETSHPLSDASALSSPVPVAPAPLGSPQAPRALVCTPHGDDTTHLKDWQRQCLEARLALLAELDRRLLVEKPGVALRRLAQEAQTGQLPAELQALVSQASSGQLTPRTLSRWQTDRARGLIALAPRSKEPLQRVPPWAGALLKFWPSPSGIALAWAVRQLRQPGALPKGVPPPSTSAAYRFVKKMDAVDRQRGRMGPEALKSVRPYRRRDVSGLWPTDLYSMDGHTFDAEVAHPFHGQPFRPEITTVLDLATRKIVGWSVTLAESALAVLDALRHACESHGIPALLYVDNGRGYRNALMEHQAVGFLARLGITMTNSLPYVSQSRGAIERLHRTLWVTLAKTLPTYMGQDMDREAKRHVFKITRQEIKTTGKSRLLMAWPHFLQAVEQAVADYNGHHEHTALPKIIDATGRKRHQTANEVWADLLAQNPECLVPVDPAESADLFRPYKVGKIRRAQVRLFGNIYFHADLAGHHGETAFIGYDLHDGQQVWVRDREHRLIAIAQADANQSDHHPISAFEAGHLQRAKARHARLERHQQDVALELEGSRPVIEGQLVTPEEAQAAAQELAALLPPPADPTPPSDQRPRIFGSDLALWQWVQDHPDLATEHDRAYLAECLEDDDFRLLTELEAQKKSRVKAA
ncbi:MAG: Mu transposase C-terminal domain-containing protein [Candidatus Contendobacter sp.]